jgi:PAS domain S-box-containing protein
MIESENIFNAKILIVDDQEANIMLLEQMLQGAGYKNVTSTRGPFPVRELHRKNRYDLILLDMQMPGQDGFAVMESLKEIETGPYLPVLVVTAQPDLKMRALKAGARDFIGKPFEMAELLFRVRNMLEARLLHAKLTGQDVSGRARSEEALRQYGERFKLAARVLSDVVWEWNLQDQTLWWSDGFLTPFGFGHGEVTPSVATWGEHMHAADRERVMEGIQRALADGAESWSAEYRFRHKDGTYSDVKDHGFILRDTDGRALRMVGGMRDITRQISAGGEKEHARSAEDRQRLEQFQAQAISLSEELTNALAPLLPALEMLRENMAASLEGPGNRESLDNLYAHARRGGERAQELKTLIENLSDRS